MKPLSDSTLQTILNKNQQARRQLVRADAEDADRILDDCLRDVFRLSEEVRRLRAVERQAREIARLVGERDALRRATFERSWGGPVGRDELRGLHDLSERIERAQAE